MRVSVLPMAVLPTSRPAGSVREAAKLRVFQSDAYLSLDYQAQEGKLTAGDLEALSRKEVTVEKDEPLKLELAAFADCARHGLQPKVGGEQVAAAFELAIEITRRIETANSHVLSGC